MSRRMLMTCGAAGAAVLTASTVAVASASTVGPAWGAVGHRQSLYAYDTVHRAVVRESLAGGAPKRLLSNVDVEQLVVSSAGDLYVRSETGITKIAVNTGRSTPFARDLSAPDQLAVDAHGDVFVSHSIPRPQVVKVASDGTRTVVAKTAGPFASDRAGNLSQVTSTRGGITTIVSYPASGAKSTTRKVDFQSAYVGDIATGAQGVVYVDLNAGGGSGFNYWKRLAANSSTPTGLATKTTFSADGIASDGSFYRAITKGVCFSPLGHCPSDYADVQQIVRYPAQGEAPTAVAASGFTIPRGTRGFQLQVDPAANVYVSADQDPSPRLLKYKPAGGTPQTLATGSFSQLVLG